MSLRKANVQLKFIVDIEKNDLQLDKFEAYISISDLKNSTRKNSVYADSNQLLVLLNMLLNRWNQSQSSKFNLTQQQWNQFKSFFAGLENS